MEDDPMHDRATVIVDEERIAAARAARLAMHDVLRAELQAIVRGARLPRDSAYRQRSFVKVIFWSFFKGKL